MWNIEPEADSTENWLFIIINIMTYSNLIVLKSPSRRARTSNHHLDWRWRRRNIRGTTADVDSFEVTGHADTFGTGIGIANNTFNWSNDRGHGHRKTWTHIVCLKKSVFDQSVNVFRLVCSIVFDLQWKKSYKSMLEDRCFLDELNKQLFDLQY